MTGVRKSTGSKANHPGTLILSGETLKRIKGDLQKSDGSEIRNGRSQTQTSHS